PVALLVERRRRLLFQLGAPAVELLRRAPVQLLLTGGDQGRDSRLDLAFALGMTRRRPRTRGDERRLGLPALLLHPRQRDQLDLGRRKRRLRLLVLAELPLELPDPLLGGAELRGQPAPLLELAGRLRQPLFLGTQLLLGLL